VKAIKASLLLNVQERERKAAQSSQPDKVRDNTVAQRERDMARVAVEGLDLELSVLTRLWHPSIVAFIGYGIDDQDTKFIVLEYCDKGPLSLLISGDERHPSTALPPKLALKYALTTTIVPLADCCLGILSISRGACATCTMRARVSFTGT
jgi:serine/threonine protein kinase